MIKVSVIGATGYTGGELVGLLVNHPKVNIISLYAKLDKPSVRLDEEFPLLKGKTDLICRNYTPGQNPDDVDIVFLAVPHTVSIDIAPAFIKKGIRVIDLSADFRLTSPLVYQKWYGKKHSETTLLKEAVYGLPELYAKKIENARLIANPGCFPTSIILGLAPVAGSLRGSIYIDSKTGTSGAGKKASVALLFSECAGNIKPYRVLAHQHTPEIEQELSKIAGRKVDICFVPELCPIDRGISTTIFAKTEKNFSDNELIDIYKKFYKKSHFVKVLEENHFPELKNVVHTNACHIGLKTDGKNLVIMTAIDNLLKGAAGQAVQNMNIMFGFPEDMSLL